MLRLYSWIEKTPWKMKEGKNPCQKYIQDFSSYSQVSLKFRPLVRQKLTNAQTDVLTVC